MVKTFCIAQPNIWSPSLKRVRGEYATNLHTGRLLQGGTSPYRPLKEVALRPPPPPCPVHNWVVQKASWVRKCPFCITKKPNKNIQSQVLNLCCRKSQSKLITQFPRSPPHSTGNFWRESRWSGTKFPTSLRFQNITEKRLMAPSKNCSVASNSICKVTIQDEPWGFNLESGSTKDNCEIEYLKTLDAQKIPTRILWLSFFNAVKPLRQQTNYQQWI